LSYIGAKPLTAEYYYDVFNGDGVTTSFVTTLSAASPVSTIVTVNGTILDPQLYFFQNNTINFFTAPAVGTRNIQVRYLSVPSSGVAAPSTYRQVDEFTAVDGQTTFNVRYYDLGYIDVYINGVQLANDDYQASDNQTIILQVAARKGDLVRIVSAYNTVLTRNYYNQTANTLLVGNGANSFQQIAPGASGNILTSNGTNWISSPSPEVQIGDAWDTANAAFNKANSTAITANTDYTTLSTTAGAYGNSTTIPVVTLAANGRVSSITNTAIAIGVGSLTYSATGLFAGFEANSNSYQQVVLQNANTGTQASADFVVSNLDSTDGFLYGDFGINGPNFVGTGALNTANTVYLYSSNTDLAIGTATSNTIHFVVNNGSADSMNVTTSGVNINVPLTTGNIIQNGVNTNRIILRNQAKGAYANLDNISMSVNAAGYPLVSSVSGTISVFWAWKQMRGSGLTGNTYTGSTLTTTPVSIGVGSGLSSGGDTVDIFLTEQNGNNFYRITCTQMVTSGNASILIERLG
jgi:hypothetical protein